MYSVTENSAVTLAQQRIAAILANYQERMLTRWAGYEQILLTELVRALDEAAFAFTLAPNREQLRRDDAARRLMLRGAATAIGPLLPLVRERQGGLPWISTNPDLARAADGHLMNCGQLADVARIAAMERYGLATSTFVRDDHLIFETAAGDAEHHDLQTLQRVRGLIQEGRANAEEALLKLTPTVHERLDAYVAVDRDHFIRYDNDEELVEYYEALASIRATDFFEAEALPGNSQIGGLSFDAWCSATVTASGRTLQHAAFASRLMALHPELQFRNLLTIAARSEDLVAVLRQVGRLDADSVSFMSAMTLDAAGADE